MLHRILCLAVAVAVTAAAGCSDSAIPDPKPASGKTDPRLKPAEAAAGATQKASVKGD